MGSTCGDSESLADSAFFFGDKVNGWSLMCGNLKELPSPSRPDPPSGGVFADSIEDSPETRETGGSADKTGETEDIGHGYRTHRGHYYMPRKRWGTFS